MGTFSKTPQTTGAFIMTSYTPGVGAKFDRNPNWWAGKSLLDGVDATYYSDNAAVDAAMLGGQVDLMVLQAAAALPQARSGAVKILANLSPRRSPVIPEVPTSDEAGIAGLYAPGWFALFGPNGMPKDVVAKLSAAMMHALADPKVRQRMSELGLDVVPPAQQTPEALAAFHKAEIEKWWPVIKAANIKVE